MSPSTRRESLPAGFPREFPRGFLENRGFAPPKFPRAGPGGDCGSAALPAPPKAFPSAAPSGDAFPRDSRPPTRSGHHAAPPQCGLACGQPVTGSGRGNFRTCVRKIPARSPPAGSAPPERSRALRRHRRLGPPRLASPPRLRTRHNRPRPAGLRPPPSIAHRPAGDLHIGSVRPRIPVPGNSRPPSSSPGNSPRALALGRFPCEPPAPRGLVLFRFAEEHSPAETGGWRGPGARAAARLAPVTPLASRSRPGCPGLASAERERKPLSWRPERTPDPGRVWPGPSGDGRRPRG